MNRSNEISKGDVIIGLILAAVFLSLCAFFWDFTLDDAFISYRYSSNLANAGKLAWNLGEDPVEGYTSFLWVLLNTAGILVGLSPVIFSKIVSVLSAISVLWIILRYGRYLTVYLKLICVGALAFSPAFAFLTVQGMETSLATLLLTIQALIALKLLGSPRRGSYVLFYSAIFLGGLTRPDSLVFSFGLMLGILFAYIVKKDVKLLQRYVAYTVLFLLAGIAYMIWRLNYFGYILPNTFYVKVGMEKGTIAYALSFIVDVLLPYIILGLFLLDRANLREGNIWWILSVVIGTALFMIFMTMVRPMQAFLWRYPFPVFPVIILLIMHVGNIQSNREKPIKRNWVLLILTILFCLWTLHTFVFAYEEMKNRNQTDRVLTGIELKGINGTMFVSESGAIPYYSEWKAVDLSGLNSEEIAHKGLTKNYLYALNPDLIMKLFSGIYDPFHTENEYPVVHQYLVEAGFVAVAAIRKNENSWHYYFVRKDSRFFDDIRDRLRTIDGVSYGDLEVLLVQARDIPILR